MDAHQDARAVARGLAAPKRLITLGPESETPPGKVAILGNTELDSTSTMPASAAARKPLDLTHTSSQSATAKTESVVQRLAQIRAALAPRAEITEKRIRRAFFGAESATPGEAAGGDRITGALL